MFEKSRVWFIVLIVTVFISVAVWSTYSKPVRAKDGVIVQVHRRGKTWTLRINNKEMVITLKKLGG